MGPFLEKVPQPVQKRLGERYFIDPTTKLITNRKPQGSSAIKSVWAQAIEQGIVINSASKEVSLNGEEITKKEREAEHIREKLIKADELLKELSADLEKKTKTVEDAKTTMDNLVRQQNEASDRATASERQEKELSDNVADCKRDVTAKQTEVKNKTIDKRRCGFLYAFFDTFTAVLYMNVMRILAKALACTGYGGTGAPEHLINLPDETCFVNWHAVVAPLALLGMCCLYPSAVLTRPLFQALDPKLNLR